MLTYSGHFERATKISVHKDPLSMELLDMIRTDLLHLPTLMHNSFIL